MPPRKVARQPIAVGISALLLVAVMALSSWLIASSPKPRIDGVQTGLQKLAVGQWSATPVPSVCPQFVHAGRYTSGGQSVIWATRTFSDVASARSSFAELKASGLTCLTNAYVQNGLAVAGLGDEAIGLQTGSAKTPHVYLLIRSGAHLDLLESETYSDTQLATALAQAVTTRCAKDAVCPATPKISKTVAPPVDPVGYLAVSDLPQIADISSKWNASEVEADFNLAFTQCEGINLANGAGPIKRGHRAYVLLDAPEQFRMFGLDEVVLTLPDEGAATAFADQLRNSISQCAEKFPMTTVDTSATATDQLSNYYVQQKAESKTLDSRLSVFNSRNQVGYLYVNSMDGFDFSDDDWNRVTLRALERLGQTK